MSSSTRVCDQCIDQPYLQAHIRRCLPYDEVCDYCFSDQIPTMDVAELARILEVILELFFEISSLRGSMEEDQQAPPGVPLRTVFAYLIQAKHSVEDPLIEHLLGEFMLEWEGPDDEDLDPDEFWYTWRGGVVPGPDGLWEEIVKHIPTLLSA